jgi:hypothetical protein
MDIWDSFKHKFQVTTWVKNVQLQVNFFINWIVLQSIINTLTNNLEKIQDTLTTQKRKKLKLKDTVASQFEILHKLVRSQCKS